MSGRMLVIQETIITWLVIGLMMGLVALIIVLIVLIVKDGKVER